MKPADFPKDLESTARRLSGIGLLDADALWTRLAQDAWKLDGLYLDVNASVKPPARPSTHEEVARAVAFVTRADALARVRSSRVKQWAIVLLIPFVLLGSWRYGVRPPAKTIVAAATSALPPFRVVRDQDVADVALDARVAATLGALPRSKVVGHYTTGAVAAGASFAPGSLRDGSRLPGLSTRSILTVPVRPVDASLAASLPAVVALVVADGTGGTVEQRDIYLLALGGDNRAGWHATIAVPPDMIGRFAAPARPAVVVFSGSS